MPGRSIPGLLLMMKVGKENYTQFGYRKTKKEAEQLAASPKFKGRKTKIVRDVSYAVYFSGPMDGVV